ncbi:MAG: polyketide synthase family protein, partial [Chthonomonadales bacterium]|nr:polyketide synthase family protein [Chthonomonadales bacterium]
MKNAIAVVGMACRYPDAKSPQELWENVLAQRRAFRRIPPERLRLEDYLSEDRRAPDHIYMGEAALIEGYAFDRVRYHVMGSTYRTADLTHWLALDVAAEALQNSGVVIEGAARETTGVIVGNTLTGEFTRAGLMRVRWPYVRRNVEAALLEEGWEPERRAQFLEVLELRYKQPFPEVGEESLAGGLSNTIAGRICNYFNFQGGGYTVDGACASSLLALTTACSALAAGDLDVALAGGVDLSIDPFELVGFAKTGALAAEEMRVFDVRSAGFWPGEGCGFAVLMRHEDAIAQGRTVHTVIRGWGVSSDGSGGITRPEVDGQRVALRKAYRRAGFGIDTVSYFECHGTGTSVGDATELEALTRARRDANETAPPAVVGSIKATIGHTKAAAGMAGFFNAAMALQHRTLPPQSGCEQPHPLLNGEASMLRVLKEAEPWPDARPLRAGVSGMGFGGINAHLVMEA